MAKFKLGVAPKLILIAAVVGAAGYAGNKYLESRPVEPAATVQNSVPVQQESRANLSVDKPADIPQPVGSPVFMSKQVEQVVNEPQQSTTPSRPDRGLDALMQNANKK